MKGEFLLIIGLLTLPIASLAESPPNTGQYWKSLSTDERVAYLGGYNDGLTSCWWEVIGIFPEFIPKDSSLRQNALEGMMGILKDYSIDNEKIDYVTLSKTMANLFEDPANAYIELHEMIAVATYKVKGELTEERLLEARKSALRKNELLKELKEQNKK